MNANEAQRADKAEIQRLRLALAQSSEQQQRDARHAEQLAKRICEVEDAIAMLAQEWRGRSVTVARLDALTSAWAKRRVALDGGGES
jgi:hypothetical protein